MKSTVALFALALFSCARVAVAQGQFEATPPLHKPSARQVGIEWQAKSAKWEIESRPIFLRDKAFQIKNIFPQQQGMFALMACPGGDGKGNGYAVWNLTQVRAARYGSPNVKSTFYNATSGWSFYSPRFSPDGSRILARFGLPPDDVRNAFELVVWDLKNGQISRPRLYSRAEMVDGKPQPRGIAYFNPGVYWSPGGRYISFVRGGDSLGGYFDALGNPWSPNGYELWVADTKANAYAQRLVNNVGLDWTWTHHNTILYSRVTAETSKSVRSRQGRPSIYEVSVAEGTSQKLFDGGCFARESPDGQWIAFIDWPGPLLEPQKPGVQQSEEAVKPGVYLFHRPTRRRIAVGEFTGLPTGSPAIQWALDSQSFYILNTQKTKQGVSGILYQADVETPKMVRLSELPVDRPLRGNNTATANWFEFRGMSPDGRRLYANTTQYLAGGPRRYINALHTLWSIDSLTGRFTAMASLTSIANENPGWDWRDTGQNPKTASQKSK